MPWSGFKSETSTRTHDHVLVRFDPSAPPEEQTMKVTLGESVVVPARKISAGTDNWVCVGASCWPTSALVLDLFADAVLAPLTSMTGRLTALQWARYRARLADIPSSFISSAPKLTQVTEDIIQALRTHPDRRENQLRSGLEFWNLGLRRAYIWMEPEGPLCIQWLLTEADNAKLRVLPNWAGMYPQLSPGQGQVENLFTFTNVRRRGIATQFAYGMYQAAQQAGLREIVTHIHEHNVAACGWAERTGWHRYGTIIRYQADLPGLRNRELFLHRTSRNTRRRSRYAGNSTEVMKAG
jgi:ribosomal protein S18 acetylase RimI-like enzyme